MQVRNLRIREDTAKYLLNLDVDSAHYDPKTRSMREDPTPNADPEKRKFRGDNFYRKSGETVDFEQMNRYSWDAFSKGQEISLQAAPSQAEKLHKEFQQKKELLTTQKKKDILERYGNAASDVPEELLLGQTEVRAVPSRMISTRVPLRTPCAAVLAVASPCAVHPLIATPTACRRTKSTTARAASSRGLRGPFRGRSMRRTCSATITHQCGDHSGREVRVVPVALRVSHVAQCSATNHRGATVLSDGSPFLKLSGKWGYACCHSFVRNAYCTGSKGIEAARDAEDLMRQNLEVRAKYGYWKRTHGTGVLARSPVRTSGTAR